MLDTKVLIIFLMAVIACGSENKSNSIDSEQQEASIVTASKVQLYNLENDYDIDKVNEVFALEPNLVEISGLAYSNIDSTFYTVNDEEGKLFVLNQNMEIISSIKFGKNGDYEGVSLNGTAAFVVKSNGKVFSIDEGNIASFKVDGLNEANDIEGIAYDSKLDGLMLALKGQGLYSDEKSVKSLCTYDLNSKELKEYIKIDRSSIMDHFDQFLSNAFESKAAIKKAVSRLKSFAPSGLAIHPENGNLFVLSARGSLLFVFNEKKLVDIALLNEKTIPQPEGICFDSNNNLYISTEGKSLVGKIFKFNYRSNQ